MKGGGEMNYSFAALLDAHRRELERFVYFRVPNPDDAEDIVQDCCLAALRGFDRLADAAAFRAWLIGIARNKCNEYFRRRARAREIPSDGRTLEELGGSYSQEFCDGAGDLLESLGGNDREILRLRCLCGLTVAQTALRLGIPEGTVKSRLHAAKARVRANYSYVADSGKEPNKMENTKKMPDIMPEYTIEWTGGEPFAVKWEEMMGWFIVPRPGESIRWAMYDFPDRRRTELCEMRVTGRAEVHGIEGVEIESREYEAMECNKLPGQEPAVRRFAAQLTDTHCRILAESHVENGVRKLFTFLDDEAFLGNWGFGENNCGNEVALAPKGDIVRTGREITCRDKSFLLDITGRCRVTIGGRDYDTVCVMDVETYNDGVVSEQFLDRNGRTVLWRRFNRDGWRFERYGRRWSELLPYNERITVNGEVYVHWYDCITDYIL